MKFTSYIAHELTTQKWSQSIEQMQSASREVQEDPFFKGPWRAAAATVTATGRFSETPNTPCTEVF